MRNAYCHAGFTHDNLTGAVPPVTGVIVHYIPASSDDWSVDPECAGTGVLHVYAPGTFTVVVAHGPVTFDTDDLQAIDEAHREAWEAAFAPYPGDARSA